MKVNGTQRKIHVAVVSDIHLGAKRNPAGRIIQNLRDAFPDNAQTADLDIICLAGDVFDGLLSLPDDEVTDIKAWIVYMLRLCKKHDIVLRVLEGTPSHDWKQSKLFPSLNEVTQIGTNLKYVTELSIEYIPELDITVGYVPDEWLPKTEDTLAQFQEILRSRGLTQIDFAFMHGNFDYQLKPIIKAPRHSSQEWLKIVKHLIFIGHIHLFSQFERIIAQGSFDRLSHGEEGPKGHVRAIVNLDTGQYTSTFVENVNALKFITVDCVGLDLQPTLEKIDQLVKTLPQDAHIRIEANRDNPVFTNTDLLIKHWPFITFSKLPRDDAQEQSKELIEEDQVYNPITITQDNIQMLITERLNLRGVEESIIQMSNRILQEVK